MNIFEGLTKGDLSNLVSSTISIDEYDSKIDDTSIVIGFTVNFKDPAKDLNSFIQKSPVDLIDTDISPSPNEDGNYMVFLELSRDSDFPERIVDITNSIKNLANISSWKFTCYGHDGVYDLTEKNIKKLIRLHSKETVDSDDLKEYFLDTICDNFEILEDSIRFIKGHRSLEIGCLDFIALDSLNESSLMEDVSVALDEVSQRDLRRIRSFLGYDWIVESFNSGVFLIQKKGSRKIFLGSL